MLTRSMWRPICAGVMVALLLLPWPTHAQGEPAWRAAEHIQSALFAAQTALINNADAAPHVADAVQRWQGLAPEFGAAAPNAAAQVKQALGDARTAADSKHAAALAVARSSAWAALLRGAYDATLAAIANNEPDTAQTWLLLREYRTATRFSRPDADATLALQAWRSGTGSADNARAAVVADLLDTYQARLNDALATVDQSGAQGFAVRRAAATGLARGYWQILAPAYREQRGDASAQQTDAAWAALVAAAQANDDAAVATARQQLDSALDGFRAAPLTADEQARRAGQMLRFLGLVPVEYGRGVRNGQVTLDLEIGEAATFRDGAAAAFADLQPALAAHDAAKTQQVDDLLEALRGALQAAQRREAVADPAAIAASAENATRLLKDVMPATWQASNTASDFDVIASVLDQMEAAVAAGQYEQAESARLEAYAIYDVGAELRLQAFAPQLVASLEGLFWQGNGEQIGLAQAIAAHAPAKDVKRIRAAMNEQLAEAQTVLGDRPSAPVAIATNAAIIVFREGLEAVVILASLSASMVGAYRRFRKPLMAGAVGAFMATALTWVLAQTILQSLSRFGERLEAVVSLIAIGVLLLITNWFFHNVYWTGWMAQFHSKKKRLIGGAAGQLLGLALLGFTSIYREGFETVLFLQALVLDAGTTVVLQGVGMGMLGVAAVGAVTFALQRKLPYKKMLIVTGVLIGGVLLVMVGNTVHVLQAVAWLPLTLIAGVQVPYWMGLWFGVFATWEGVIGQALSAAFVIGSYYMAEHLRHRKAPGAAAHVPQPQSR